MMMLPPPFMCVAQWGKVDVLVYDHDGTPDALLPAYRRPSPITSAMEAPALDRGLPRLLPGRDTLRPLQHCLRPGARHEADADLIREHEVSRSHRDSTDGDRLVDRDGFDTPLAGDRAEAARPYGIADAARMIDIAHAAIDNRADLALAAGNAGEDVSHVGNEIDALENQHVAWLGEVMRLDIGQHRDAAGEGFGEFVRAAHIVHRQGAADDAR